MPNQAILFDFSMDFAPRRPVPGRSGTGYVAAEMVGEMRPNSAFLRSPGGSRPTFGSAGRGGRHRARGETRLQAGYQRAKMAAPLRQKVSSYIIVDYWNSRGERAKTEVPGSAASGRCPGIITKCAGWLREWEVEHSVSGLRE